LYLATCSYSKLYSGKYFSLSAFKTKLILPHNICSRLIINFEVNRKNLILKRRSLNTGGLFPKMIYNTVRVV
jgi:hypothetical protein